MVIETQKMIETKEKAPGDGEDYTLSFKERSFESVLKQYQFLYKYFGKLKQLFHHKYLLFSFE